MISTSDFDSGDPSSDLGRTSVLFFRNEPAGYNKDRDFNFA